MRVLIIRHTEKPEEEGNPHLSGLGWRRAVALARSPGAWAGRIDAIFAAAPRPDSNRPLETVALLAAALALPIRCDLREGQEAVLAARLADPAAPWRDGTALVCWRHKFIPALAAALGARDVPDRWPDDLYGPVWALTPDGTGRMRLDSSGRLPAP